MTDTNDLLEPVRRILSSPEKWTKGCSAYDSDGYPVLPTEPEAVRWCLLGAAQKAYCRDLVTGVVVKNELRRRSPGWFVSFYNDDPTTTFEDIQRLLAEPFYGPAYDE
jgi:hypothetical protein